MFRQRLECVRLPLFFFIVKAGAVRFFAVFGFSLDILFFLPLSLYSENKTFIRLFL